MFFRNNLVATATFRYKRNTKNCSGDEVALKSCSGKFEEILSKIFEIEYFFIVKLLAETLIPLQLFSREVSRNCQNSYSVLILHLRTAASEKCSFIIIFSVTISKNFLFETSKLLLCT